MIRKLCIAIAWTVAVAICVILPDTSVWFDLGGTILVVALSFRAWMRIFQDLYRKTAVEYDIEAAYPSVVSRMLTHRRLGICGRSHIPGWYCHEPADHDGEHNYRRAT